MKLEEEWKNIKDYPNYQVSNLGRVKSKERYTKQKNGINLRREKLLNLQKNYKGYLYVRLYNNKGFKNFKVHTLVAKHFIPNILNEPTVDHIDRNKQNNRVDNLRWANYIIQANNKNKENIIKNMKILGKKSYKNRAKKVKQYDKNGNFIKEWESSRQASIELGIIETSISNCINKISKSAGGYIWER